MMEGLKQKTRTKMSFQINGVLASAEQNTGKL